MTMKRRAMRSLPKAASIAVLALLVGMLAPPSPPRLATHTASSSGQTNAAADRDVVNQGDRGRAYVADNAAASDSNECRSWATACATVQHALDVVGAGTVEVGEGDFVGPITLGTGQHLVGSGTESTFIRPDGDSGTAVTIADAASASIERLRIGSSSETFDGVLLENLGTKTHVEDVEFENWDPDPKQGYGGTGLLTSNGEGQRYETIGFGLTRLAMDICGANHVFTNIRGSGNFHILRECTGQDKENGGHHHVYGMKFTHAGYTGDEDPAQVTTVVLDDNGGWIFNNADLDESDNSLIAIDSAHNEFNNPVIAPGSEWQVRGPAAADDDQFGHHNVFNDLTVLGKLADGGQFNEYWRPFAPYENQVTIDGDHILVESRDVGWDGNFDGPGVYHYAKAPGPGE